MNIFKIIDEIQQVDGDAVERLQHATRRSFMTKFSRTMAAAAVPTAMGAIFNKAYAFTPGAIDVLKFALTLEYLEEEFYIKGTNSAGLIPAEYGVVFNQIKKHETQHVKFLETALGLAPGAAKPKFDFTAKNTYPDVFSKFDTFVFLSHAFEDTGVRAYKGQAGNLMAKEDEPLLDYALQIHSVEARHAAKSRFILSTIRNNTRIKPWITLNEGSPAPVYADDNNVIQGGKPLNDGFAGKSLDAITESFDEPLTKEQVLAIATPFLA